MTGTMGTAGGFRRSGVLLAVGLSSVAVGCGANGPTSADHNVYFEGNAYDGAMSGIIGKDKDLAVSIEYRDKLVKVAIGDDGRFTSQDPLPTWQDYMVTIAADGYRAFVSHNPGFEVPASLAAMQQGLADITTTQTFSFDAYLFPDSLMTPPMTITVATIDDKTANPVFNVATGTMRLRPQSQSSLQVGATDSATGTPRTSRRVWSNDNDLLGPTITKMITAGKVDFAMGELVYGVQYEVSVYDVDGYQPSVSSPSTPQNLPIVAGTVMSRTIQLTKLSKDPLRIVASTASMCTPPAPSSTTPGAQIVLTFSEPIEAVGTTLAEDVDNGLNIVSTSTSFPTCPLKSGFGDPTKQERGSSVVIAATTMTFAWNPSIGLTPPMDPVSGLMVCTTPSAITSVAYGIQTVSVQPVGDPTRKAGLSTLLQAFAPTSVSTSLVCPSH